MSAELYVQYGCGWSAPDGWLNFDSSPTLWFERLPLIGKLYTKNASRFPEAVRYGDIVSGLPILDQSCDAIYCSHVLEHLSRQDADTALANTYRYLKPGAVFRIVLPDLEQLARGYLEERSPDAAHRFMKESFLGQETRPRGLFGFLRHWLGHSAHLWMWDERSLRAALERHGFCDIRRCQFGDAEDPRFSAVENIERFTGHLAMEARR